jgi:hypothetical protein
VTRHYDRCRRTIATLLGVPRAPLAAEGLIEINQARALAGDVTPGDTPGFPVVISESGSYVLTGDLDLRAEAKPADTTAILITADFVWLDLNGFSIIGPFACAGAPPTQTGTGDGIASASSHVTVTGGHVRGVGRDAISLGANARVYDVVVTCSGRTGIFTGVGALVTGSRVDDNADFGLDLGAGSAFGGNVLRGNDGGGDGLQVAGGATLVELHANSCAETTTCEICGDGSCTSGEVCSSCAIDCCSPAPITKVVSVVCSDNITANLTEIPFELTVDPGLIVRGGAFTAQITATGMVPQEFLQAAVNTIPGITELTLNAFQATVTVRSGATGADVLVDLDPTPQNLPIPLDGTGTVATGHLLVPLSTETGSYVAASSGEVLFEFSGSIVPVIATNPPGPTGIRTLAVVLAMAFECASGSLNDNGTPGDPTDDFLETHPDSALLSFPIP